MKKLKKKTHKLEIIFDMTDRESNLRPSEFN